MKKKITLLLLCCLILFTSCGKSDSFPFPYKDNAVSDNTSSNITIDTSHNSESALFADKLCIIPKEQNDTDDKITAESAMIINTTDKKAVFASNPYKKLYPASITKILTAYITLKYTKPDDIVTVSHDAANISEEGIKRCGFNEGDKITVKDLLYSMLIYSGNDAATALGCHICGTENEFAKLMNKEAKLLGATKSHFVNANGLHNDKHYTTAYDLYLIFSACLEYDEFKTIIHTDSYTVNYKNAENKDISKKFESTNQYLLGSEKAPDGITVTGGKTGTTNKAGHCLILFSEDTDGKSYISVILNADSTNSLYDQMTHLLSLTQNQ